MTKDLWTFKVSNRQSFQEFLGLLLIDYKANKAKWENQRLDHFLEAMEAYVGDLDGYYLNHHPDLDADTPTWSMFADILRGAVVYE